MAVYRESFVVHIDCADPVALWSGVGPILIPADDIIPSDLIALGGDELISTPDFQTLINGTAERLDLVVSGVSEILLPLALDAAAQVRGAPVHIGLIRFLPDWSIDFVEWENMFEARSLRVSRPQEQNGQVTRSITLTIVQGDSTRSMSPNAYSTDADQRRTYPTDAIFSNVGGINAGTSRRFGPSD